MIGVGLFKKQSFFASQFVHLCPSGVFYLLIFEPLCMSASCCFLWFACSSFPLKALLRTGKLLYIEINLLMYFVTDGSGFPLRFLTKNLYELPFQTTLSVDRSKKCFWSLFVVLFQMTVIIICASWLISRLFPILIGILFFKACHHITEQWKLFCHLLSSTNYLGISLLACSLFM